MPLPLIPLILGGASLIAGALGLGGTLSGKEKIEKAKRRIEDAKAKYERKERELEREHKKATAVLDDLGKSRLEIRESFKRFADAFEKIQNRPEIIQGREEHFSFSTDNLRDIKQDSVSAWEILLGLTGSAVAGGAAGGAAATVTFGLVGLFGTASTGTAIGSLTGAAATKATLAWLGGGALSAGGWGMAAGTAVLGGLILGPAVFAIGWMTDSKGDEALEKAREAEREVEKAVRKINKAVSFLRNLSELASALLDELKITHALYEQKVTLFEQLVERCDDWNRFSEDDKVLLDNNIMLVKLLSEMTKVDLLKKDDDTGELLMESSALRNDEVEKVVKNSSDYREKLAA